MEDNNDVPESLLHEVHQLIDKERALLELKLLDQQLESEKWRTKYDTLKDKVIETGVEENQAENIEVVADIEMMEASVHKWENVDEIIAARVVQDYFANLSDIPLSRTMFISLIKNLFGAKTSFPNIRVVSMRNCSLSVQHQDTIVHLVRSSRIAALDLSRNDIREEAFIHMLDVIGKRKSSPQYLLFDSNITFSETSKSFIHLFKVLSEDTWGLSISLQDYPSNYMDLMEKAIRKTRRGGPDDTNDIKELVKPPMKMVEFLQAMNARMMESKGMATKSKKSLLQQAIKLAQDVEINERLTRPFNSLSVLALTQCHLSRKSLLMLQQSVTLMRDTLTDLDLSFSYMGFNGAEIIKSILSDPQSQLIRLDLKGNVLRDNSMHVIAPSLRTNQTLIHLNLSGNCLSDTSAWATYEAAKSNPILQYIDFRRNNDITDTAMNDIDHQLRIQGSELYMHWDEYSHPPSAVKEKDNAASIVFMRTRAYKKICSVGKSCKLFSLNLAKVYQSPAHQNVPLLFQFFLRPKSVNSLLQIQKRMFEQPPRYEDYRKKRITDDPFFHINTDLKLTWEIIVKQKEEIVYKYETDLSAAFVTKHDLENDQPYVFCGCVVSQLPTKGILEVRVRLQLFWHDAEWDPSNSFMAVETRDCLIKYTELSPWHLLGGDGECDPNALQSFLNEAYVMYLDIGDKMFVDHSILRSFTWRFITRKVRVRWESKLAVIEDAKQSTASNTTSNESSTSYSSPAVQSIVNADAQPTKSHEALHYETLISVYQHHGLLREIKRIQSEVDYSTSLSSTNSSSATANVNDPIQAVLHSWIWQENEVEIPDMQVGDIVLITTKIISKDAKILASLGKKCMVLGRNCQVYTYLGDLRILSTTDILDRAVITSHPEAIFSGPAPKEPHIFS